MEFEKLIKPYNGDGDIGMWLKKVKLVARMKKLKDLATIIPLYLEGQAYMVYDHMNPIDQEDVEKIENVLINAFSIDVFEAYDEFRTRSWHNEAVDVYLADLMRLADLAKIQGEAIIKMAFVVGLPKDVGKTLRTTMQADESEMSELVQRARILMADRSAISCFIASGSKNQQNVRNYQNLDRTPSNQSDRHVMKKIICWSCKEAGHLARNCNKKSENGLGVTAAPAVSP